MERRTILLAAIALVAPQITSMPAYAGQDQVYQSFFGTAIDGTDPISYFDEGRPIEGDGDITYQWNGATWRFASTENRDRFAADPEAYAPQYGGYCAWAVSQGYTASTDPEAWSIVDGKLYLNYSLSVREKWERDVPGNIASANKNWPSVLD
jgi:YHS domain-containing protein